MIITYTDGCEVAEGNVLTHKTLHKPNRQQDNVDIGSVCSLKPAAKT